MRLFYSIRSSVCTVRQIAHIVLIKYVQYFCNVKPWWKCYIRQRSCSQRVGCLQWLGSRAFEPAKRSGLRFLSTVPCIIFFRAAISCNYHTINFFYLFEAKPGIPILKYFNFVFWLNLASLLWIFLYLLECGSKRQYTIDFSIMRFGHFTNLQG